MFLQGLSCVIVVAIALLAYRPIEAQDRVRLGLSSISATSGSIWVAEEKGLFKKQGVNVEVIFIGGGASRVVSALLSGEIQFSVGGGDAVIRAALRGADTVLTASPMSRGRRSQLPGATALWLLRLAAAIREDVCAHE